MLVRNETHWSAQDLTDLLHRTAHFIGVQIRPAAELLLNFSKREDWPFCSLHRDEIILSVPTTSVVPPLERLAFCDETRMSNDDVISVIDAVLGGFRASLRCGKSRLLEAVKPDILSRYRAQFRSTKKPKPRLAVKSRFSAPRKPRPTQAPTPVMEKFDAALCRQTYSLVVRADLDQHAAWQADRTQLLRSIGMA